MSEPNQTPVYIDRSIENVRILEENMAREKGITSLKGCVLAAIDFYVQHLKLTQLNNGCQVKSSKDLSTARQDCEQGGSGSPQSPNG